MMQNKRWQKRKEHGMAAYKPDMQTQTQKEPNKPVEYTKNIKYDCV